MYWPSRALDLTSHTAATGWQFHPGGPGCQESGQCHFPRDERNSKPVPVPNGGQRVVLVVMGGLNAQAEYTKFLSFRKRAGWKADGLELAINSQVCAGGPLSDSAPPAARLPPPFG